MVINEIEFPLKVRGYDPDEVDDFLERMAVGVGQLQERLEQLAERAAVAERRAAELEQRPRPAGRDPAQASAEKGPAGPDQAEELSRTLLMAQRFVDQTMGEAKDDAERIVSEARAEAEGLRAEADTELRRIRTESHAQIAEEVRQLETTRESLRGDVDALGTHVEAQRERLRSSLAAFDRLLDDPEGLRAAAGPELSGASLPDFARGLGGPAGDEPADQPTAAEADEDEDAPDRDTVEAVPDEDEDAGWSRFAQGPEPAEAGPPTAVHIEEGADPYLAELRRAMSEGQSGRPAAETEAFFDQDQDPTHHQGRTRRPT